MAFQRISISVKDLLEMLPTREAPRTVAPDTRALLRLARALDEQGMTKQADRIAKAMVRSAQYNDQTLGGYYGQQIPTQYGDSTPGFVGQPTFVNPGGAIQSGMPVPEFGWGGGEVAPNRAGEFSFSPGSELGDALGAMGAFRTPSSSQMWRLPGDRFTFSNPNDDNPRPFQALDMAQRASGGNRNLQDAYWTAMNSSDPQQVLRSWQEGSTAIPMRGAPGGGGLAFRSGTPQDLQGEDLYHPGTWQEPSALLSGPATSTGKLQAALPSRFESWGGSQRPAPGAVTQLPYRPVGQMTPSLPQAGAAQTRPSNQVGVVSSKPLAPQNQVPKPFIPVPPEIPAAALRPRSKTKFRSMRKTAQLGWGSPGQYAMTPQYAQYQQPMGNYQNYQGQPNVIDQHLQQAALQRQYQQNVDSYNQALRTGNQPLADQLMMQQQYLYGNMNDLSKGNMENYYSTGAGSPENQAQTFETQQAQQNDQHQKALTNRETQNAQNQTAQQNAPWNRQPAAAAGNKSISEMQTGIAPAATAPRVPQADKERRMMQDMFGTAPQTTTTVAPAPMTTTTTTNPAPRAFIGPNTQPAPVAAVPTQRTPQTQQAPVAPTTPAAQPQAGRNPVTGR